MELPIPYVRDQNFSTVFGPLNTAAAITVLVILQSAAVNNGRKCTYNVTHEERISYIYFICEINEWDGN
jgi:hypothetical protein